MFARPGINGTGGVATLSYKITTTSAGTTVRFPVIGTGNSPSSTAVYPVKCRIEWGDGSVTYKDISTSTPFNSVDSTFSTSTKYDYSPGLICHKYTSAGSYTVKVISFNTHIPIGQWRGYDKNATTGKITANSVSSNSNWKTYLKGIDFTSDPLNLARTKDLAGVFANLGTTVALTGYVCPGENISLWMYGSSWSNLNGRFNNVIYAEDAFSANTAATTSISTINGESGSAFNSLAYAARMFFSEATLASSVFRAMSGKNLKDASYMWQGCTGLDYLHNDSEDGHWALPKIEHLAGFLKGCTNVHTLPKAFLSGCAGNVGDSLEDTLSDIQLYNLDNTDTTFSREYYNKGASAKDIFSRINEFLPTGAYVTGGCSNVTISATSGDNGHYYWIGVPAITNLYDSLKYLGLRGWNSFSDTYPWSNGKVCGGAKSIVLRRFKGGTLADYPIVNGFKVPGTISTTAEQKALRYYPGVYEDMLLELYAKDISASEIYNLALKNHQVCLVGRDTDYTVSHPSVVQAGLEYKYGGNSYAVHKKKSSGSSFEWLAIATFSDGSSPRLLPPESIDKMTIEYTCKVTSGSSSYYIYNFTHHLTSRTVGQKFAYDSVYADANYYAFYSAEGSYTCADTTYKNYDPSGSNSNMYVRIQFAEDDLLVP